jgi:AcrR family transcriptional regulator
VRDIANDAGVNVALISRYFDSKEGLFEACIARVGEELEGPATEAPSLDSLARALVAQVMGFAADPAPAPLLLLLRTSGDERADAIRRKILRSFAERMAAVAGWKPGRDDGDRLLLRAEMVMAAALGMMQLRSAAALEPLSSASEDELVAAVRELVGELLGTPKDP